MSAPRTPKGRIPSGRPHSLDVRLSDAERADVVALADALGTTQADAIRVAVRAELARRDVARGVVGYGGGGSSGGGSATVRSLLVDDNDAPRGGGEG